MRKLLSATYKELLILIRDIPGLLTLFIMPMLLIIAITVTQESGLEKLKESKITLLLVDNDTSLLSQTIEEGLENSKYFDLIKEINGNKLTEKEAIDAIAKGEYQIGIVIPKGSSESAVNRANKLIEESFSDKENISSLLSNRVDIVDIFIYLDPTIRNSYKNSIISSLKRLLLGVEVKIMIDNYFQVLPKHLNSKLKDQLANEIGRQLEKHLGSFAPKDLKINVLKELDFTIDKMEFPWQPESMVRVREIFAKQEKVTIKPTMVQNNVPAFALFAMFFIVIPLSGSLITERNEGAFNRLRTLPVSFSTLLAAKITVYSIVGLIQFGLMIVVGIVILPFFFNLPALEMGTHYGAIIALALASALAATGFGIIVGTFAGSNGQAAMFGSIMVVILGILGGIFLPVYIMPEPLKSISIISPMRWGIDGFLDIFVRGGDIKSVFPSILKLIIFFFVTQAIALFSFVKRN